MNFKDPYIKLVGSYDGRSRAWHHSRPHIKLEDINLNDISKVDLPVHGFATYHFEIGSSLLLRDILYLVRPSQDWARSNRTTLIDENSAVYDSLFNDIEYLSSEEVIECHKKSIDQSVNQDIRKSNFLYSFFTEYSWMVDARTLSSLVRSLKCTCLYPYADMFIEVLKENGIELVPSSYDLLHDYMIDKPVTDEDIIIREYPDLDLVSITALMTGNLASQFERQAYSTVKSELVNLIYDKKSMFELPKSQRNLIWMNSVVSTNKAIKLVKTRSCYFAQWDKESLASWSRIVVGIIKELDLDIKDCLICEGDSSKCKWKAEQLARTKAGNPNGSTGEVNPPCPIMTGIPYIHEIRKKKFDSDSELSKMWDEWSQHNDKITQEGIEYVNNVYKYGYAEKRDNESLKYETNHLVTKYQECIKDEG